MTPDELAARLKAHPFAGVREPLMQKVVLTLLRHAQPRTPVRFGHLRRSETTRVERGGLRGFVGSNLVYAPFVHRIVPFFQQAIDDGRADAQKLLLSAGEDFFQGIV